MALLLFIPTDKSRSWGRQQCRPIIITKILSTTCVPPHPATDEKRRPNKWTIAFARMRCEQASCTDARCQPRRPSTAVTLCQALLPPVYLNSAIRYPQDPTRTKTARFDTMAPEEHTKSRSKTPTDLVAIYMTTTVARRMGCPLSSRKNYEYLGTTCDHRTCRHTVL